MEQIKNIRDCLYNDEVQILFRDVVGYPSPEKISLVIKTYTFSKKYFIFGYFNPNLQGFIGGLIKRNYIIINHIVVNKNKRKKGVGKKLIKFVFCNFGKTFVYAETDTDSIGFYKKLGFKCMKYKAKFANRYKCIKLNYKFKR
ncbi:MAG: GNAT family N-acetyltransferase [Sphingobacteriia bacterium]|nr:GNAT family N-acetyltransferase [Sphingobacteriia bacterium]